MRARHSFVPARGRVYGLLAGLALSCLIAASGCSAASPTATAVPPVPVVQPAAQPATQATSQTTSQAETPTDVSAAEAPSESAAVPVKRPSFPVAGEGDIEPILATTVLNPGTQRVSFLLVGPRAIVKAPQATVSSAYVGGDLSDGQGGSGGPDGTGDSPQMTSAVYHGWPYGIRGAYSTELTFDRPGAWRLDVGVEEGEVIGSAVIELNVVEDSPIPAIGERPPLSRTKTLSDVAGIEQLTTDYTPDEEMYRISVAEAIESPRPAVVVFSSPAFCTSPTCGPQLETVKELRATYQDRAEFVHVEIYDLPDEIQGDLSRATLVEAVDEWGFSSLPHWFNESWVFIINGEGLVEQRFEGYATLTELEEALKRTLDAG